MLQLKTDLLKLNRLEKTASAEVLAAGQTGLWVAFGASDTLVLPTADGAYAVPVWTESNRDGTVGFTGDVSVTGTLTVLHGNFEGVTDMFTGTPAIGDKLYALTDGTLSDDAGASLTLSGTPTVEELGALAAAFPVAMCTKASTAMTWFGNSINVIEFVTI